MLTGVVAVGVGWVGVPEPAASAAGQVGDEGSFGASCDVGPDVAHGSISIPAGDVAAVDVRNAISPHADAPHAKTMATKVNEGPQ
ncbi:MAG: hypothetical protein DLM60_23165 [Pseudonocardiales bacterium]|nr:MAG: hypothetical protein DLM60_23165 [Pseudonocardiales bacterium]